MKTTRKWLLIALCALLILPMAQGCRQKTPEDVFTDALANMEKLESMHMRMSMEMKMSVMGQKINMTVGIEADAMNNPVKGKMDMEIKMGGMGMEMPVYYEQQGDAFMSYIGVDEGSGLVWYRQQTDTAPMNSQMVSASALTGFAYIEEEAEDENILRYRGTIGAEQLRELLEASMTGGLDALTGGDDAMLDMVIEEIGKTEMTVTVDKKSGHIIREELDMGPMMRAMLNKAMESAAEAEMEDLEEDLEDLDMDLSSLFEIGEMPVVIEFSRFNEIKDIEIPAEARQGELIEEGDSPLAA